MKKWRNLLDLETIEAKIMASTTVFLMGTGHVGFAVDWPWTNFINDLIDEFRGPHAIALGTLALIYICYGALTGEGGRAVRNTIVLIFALTFLFFAPQVIQMLYDSATAAG